MRVNVVSVIGKSQNEATARKYHQCIGFVQHHFKKMQTEKFKI